MAKVVNFMLYFTTIKDVQNFKKHTESITHDGDRTQDSARVLNKI